MVLNREWPIQTKRIGKKWGSCTTWAKRLILFMSSGIDEEPINSIQFQDTWGTTSSVEKKQIYFWQQRWLEYHLGMYTNVVTW